MTPGMPAKAAAWVVFVLVMAVMTCLTAVVLCFFLPFVVLKALWVLIVQPQFPMEGADPRRRARLEGP